jgi:hypothetical protein
MGRYDTFRYSQDLYGEDVSTANLWALEVDWTGNGFSGANEASRMVACSVSRGRNYLLNRDGNGFQRVQPGRMSVTLDNRDGRYDPYNTTSPIYPYVIPGKRFRLRVKNGTAGMLYYVMTGFIEDIQPVSGREQVLITGVDALELFSNQDIITSQVYEAIRIDDAIETILDAAGWNNYSVDALSDTIAYWWVDNRSVVNAIGELEDASLGTFFVSNDGVAKYYSRRRSAAEVLALQSDDILREIKVSQPWETVRNSIELVVNPRVEQSNAELWALQGQPSVVAGSSLEIWAAYQYDNESVPAIDVTAPSSDFAVNTASDGSGTDLTTDCSVAITAFPETAKLIVTNGSGSDGYVISLKVWGKSVIMPNPVIIRDTDPASIAIYDTRKFQIDSTWLQDSNIAIDLASVLVSLLADARKNPTVRIEARPDIQFLVDLFDRIALEIPYLNIDSAYRVGAIEHEWIENNGQSVLTTLSLEPIIDTSASYWTFPTEIGVTSILGF